MALLWAPTSPWPRRLGGLLMCKVMLESGLHKLLDMGHDPSWLNGQAMISFFEVAVVRRMQAPSLPKKRPTGPLLRSPHTTQP